VEFAEQYIGALTRDFTPARYEDTYRKALLAVIAAKAKGEEPELPERRPPPAKVRSLMEALQRSVAEVRKPPAPAGGRHAPASRRHRGPRPVPAERRGKKAA